MKAIKIKITSFISNDQPGFVECKFYDALNIEHIVQDKVPIVTEKNLDMDSSYPQEGVIACEILKEWIDENNRIIITVDTSKPWGVETIEGLTIFNILKEQLIEV
ncbi:MAG: hypothetical protein ABL929_11175 [Ferruginibacter sp.]